MRLRLRERRFWRWDTAGVYPVLGERRLYDVISAAGGFTDKAGRVVTITRRIKPDAPVTVHLPSNLSDQTDANVAVSPGDTIVVGRAGIVYVVGDVNRPSGFMIEDNNLTVLKALALAGGQPNRVPERFKAAAADVDRCSGNPRSVEEDPAGQGAGCDTSAGRHFVCPG